MYSAAAAAAVIVIGLACLAMGEPADFSMQDTLHNAVSCAPTAADIQKIQAIYRDMSWMKTSPKSIENLTEADLRVTPPHHSQAGKDDTFYLHESGALNYSAAIDCAAEAIMSDSRHRYQNILENNTHQGRGPINWDVLVEIDWAQHLGGVSILRQLRHHPKRTFDPMATKIHYLGYPSLFAFIVAHRCHHTSNTPAAAGKYAKQLMDKYSHASFIVMDTSWASSVMKEFKKSFSKGSWPNRLYIATSDVLFAQRNGYSPLKAIVVPYRANYVLNNPGNSNVQPERKNTSFFFAGTLRGAAHKALRGKVFETMGKIDVNGTTGIIIDSALTNGGNGGDINEILAETIAQLHHTYFCPAPAGDTFSSRRTFETIAAGCLPVAMGEPQQLVATLPFHHSVDWGKIMLFPGSMECLAADNGKQAKLLAQFLITHFMHRSGSAEQKNVHNMLKRASIAFRAHLNYDRPGIVDALVREMTIRVNWNELHRLSFPDSLESNWKMFGSQPQ